MIRTVVRKLGVWPSAAVITGVAIVLSVLITALVWALRGQPMSLTSLFVAVIAPAIIAPVFSYAQLSALRKLDIAEARLRELSITDALTGAYNRRHILDLAETERQRARRADRPLSVALLDVDGFKAINDTYGHQGGDAVLRQLAAICRTHTRASDHFGRYGGEEFMFALPETDTVSAVEFAERLRGILAAARVDYRGRAIAYTVSIGVATLLGDEDLSSLLLRADNALYGAKRRGKNILVVAEAVTPGLTVH